MRQNVGSTKRWVSPVQPSSKLGLTTLGLSLLLAGCSGSSSSAEPIGSAGGAFQLSSMSVSNGQAWQINRAIAFTFSAAVDFSTVNLNTISIQELNGTPAVGDFMLSSTDSRTVIFQPVCPTLNDFSDAGFRPGGTSYLINVPTLSSGPGTVRSASDKPLTTSFPSSFTTPDSSVLAELFLDPLPGPAQASIRPGGLGDSTIVFGDQDPLFFNLGVFPGTPVDAADPQDPPNVPGTSGLAVRVPSNYYSDPDSQVVIHLRLDQPVSPKDENLQPDRIKLEYQNDLNFWIGMSTTLELESNCTGTGASIKITPVGVLPPNRNLRVVIGPEFEDLVGERNSEAQTKFAVMATVDVGGDRGDVFTENFLAAGFEDTVESLAFPRAQWGDGGLKAGFDFDGTGGPGGDFSVIIDSDKIFNTVSQSFIGGPGGSNQGSILAINGRMDVFDLTINEGATLRIEGPNPARILCAGTLTVNGTIRVNGANAKSVFTLNTPTQVEAGATGQGGGGGGGDGSFLTTQVTPFGGNGRGPYNASNGGGFGGESGWSVVTAPNGELRRAAGGGGGRLGHAQYRSFGVGANSYLCVDFDRVGLNPESGFPGGDSATSSQDSGTHIPYGGRMGPSPFGVTQTHDDDFLGSKISNVGPNEALLVGELGEIRPGSGGGGGGDATRVPQGSSYPPETLVNSHQDKGAGGGGGGGGLTILCLGDVVFGPNGKIQALGGHGNGGENTAGTNRVGGGSGGGSGGHIVIQTAKKIDFSQVVLNAGVPATGFPAIDAKGGQGGDGGSGRGGAFFGENANDDSIHTGDAATLPTAANPRSITENPWIFQATDDEFIDPLCQQGGGGLPGTNFINHIQAAGGDGGPGLIQLHVGRLRANGGPDPSDFVYPSGVEMEDDLRLMVSPVPHGYDAVGEVWRDHLLPIFGRFSAAQSKWIPLGETAVGPDSVSALQHIEFLFAGTNTTGGLVDHAGGTVDTLPRLLFSANVNVDAGDTTGHTVLMDGSGLAGVDLVYQANPSMLRGFDLVVNTVSYNIASASFDAGTFTLVTDSDAASLIGATGTAELFPRFLRVSTNGVANSLETGQSVRVEFELMSENQTTGVISTTNFSDDLDNLADVLIDQDDNKIRFIRYRLTFDLGSGDLSFTTPLPTLDFLKIPFKF